jgi:hypothetical protein
LVDGGDKLLAVGVLEEGKELSSESGGRRAHGGSIDPNQKRQRAG